jgi:sialidase-1
MMPVDAVRPLSPGWTLTTEDPTHTFPALLTARDGGSEQSTTFPGRVLGLFLVVGPDTGAFDYRIDGGEWKQEDPFDQFAREYYRPQYRLLADGLAGASHTVSIRIRPEHSPDSKGTVTRIGYLLINP